jgi:DNA mismatch repair protein MutS
MMQQYFAIKEQHKDHILFYRLGDFYEMFFDDALLASRELELVLTGRDCGLSERAPMCGIPHHAVDGYLAKLIRKGYKVAICEQMEDPAAAKGVVSREVVRVITPGTLIEGNLLDEEANNYLCAIGLTEKGCGLVFADISTGEVNAIELSGNTDELIIGELSRYSPREVVFPPRFVDRTAIAKYMREKLFCTADLLEEGQFEGNGSRRRVEAQFGKTLGELSLDAMPNCVGALGALLGYLAETQIKGLERLCTVNVVEENRYMNLDAAARANLELLCTMRTKEKRGSLLWVLDKTKTPMGKRLIKNYIAQPLLNPTEIDKRLNAVEELTKNEILCGDIAAELAGVFDVERLITRVVYGSATPREFKALQQAIGKFPNLRQLLSGVNSQNLTAIYREIDELYDLFQLLEAAIIDEPPANVREGGVIRDGYNEDLDVLRELMGNARGILLKLEQDEREKTGIKNLKIGYNKVFGYYLEITRSYQHLTPEHYIRKQTLANCERYITQELKELEERISSASEQSVAIETALFEAVREETARRLHRLQRTASAIARLDILQSFARVSLEYGYSRPIISVSEELIITEGRHPMVERIQGDALFVPNDTLLDCKENQIAVITGPNMAGKSTYMRQVALITIMAQIGCFVPAKSARVGIADGVYTRIGASDDLTSGQSTFMVEMCEVASILQSATSRSLLILDEIGRGTSTYDGMSIARAVIEYIADPKRLGAKTLFATHYHELTELEGQISSVKNYNIVAKKRGEDIIFLRKIIRGGADDSYGIEVSKLAGIPQWIIGRAHKVLADLESAQPVRQAKIAGRKVIIDPEDIQIRFQSPESKLESRLKGIDPNTLTPLEAQRILYELKAMTER